MMCYLPTGHIMFSLKKLEFYWGRGSGAGDRGPNMRDEGQSSVNPSTLIFKVFCHFFS